MRHLDLFSGIGGFALAATWVWGKDYVNVGHSEIEKFPCRVYHRHFPESECLGDITKIEWKEGQADLITGGFPCQPHSLAGKRRGSNDERDLWGECVRALSTVRPQYALFENVPGIITTDRAKTWLRIKSDVESVGYEALPILFSAEDVGANTERERVWIVAHSKQTRTFEYVEERRVSFVGSEGTRKWGENWERLELGLGDVAPEKWSHAGLGIDSRPLLLRCDDGLSSRLALEAYGNAIVPQCAEVILRAIKEVDESVSVSHSGGQE